LAGRADVVVEEVCLSACPMVSVYGWGRTGTDRTERALVSQDGAAHGLPWMPASSAGEVYRVLPDVTTMRLIVIFTLSIAFLFGHAPSSHALVPDEILVVANSAVPESIELARYYMKKRNIPSKNVLQVKTTGKEVVGRQDYEQQIAHPVKEFLIWSDPPGQRFKCLVLMYGMPLRVLPPPLSETERIQLQSLKAALGEKTTTKGPSDSKGKAGMTKEAEDKWAELKKDIRKLTRADWVASVDSELALVREKTYDLQGWLPNKYFVGFRDSLISSMPKGVTLVSRLDGPTPAVVRRVIDDSMEAEREGLKGKAYFDARWREKHLTEKGRKLSAYEMYDLAIHNTARVVRKTGRLPVILDEEPTLFAPGEAPEAAIYCGWYSLGKYIDAFTWVKGAVGYHVASSECTTLKTAGSTVWCKAMLEKGVAATIGPVAEPYLQSFPAPEVFFGCLLGGKLTLVECYALANPFWSWQQVLIGDPLYRPFGRQ
jgi:uncharacterized protein (TIGR03790 family)